MTKEAVREDRFFFISENQNTLYMRKLLFGKRRWSKEEDDNLRILHEDNYSISEIADILNRSKQAIAHRRSNLKLVHDSWSQEDDDNLRTLHREHWSISEIARILNKTVEAIRHRKKKLHLGRCLKMDGHNIVRRRKMKEKREARLCMA